MSPERYAETSLWRAYKDGVLSDHRAAVADGKDPGSCRLSPATLEAARLWVAAYRVMRDEGA